MITDPIFYRLFATSPDTFFLLLGMSIDAARDMAARYQYEALEFKETSHRLDGVFQPKEAGLPLYFLEAQFYYLPTVFADLLVKAYTYLKRHDPSQTFRGVILFGDRTMEPEELAPYRALLDAKVIERYYLNEMPELANAPLGLSILYLIRQPEDQAPATARELIARTKQEIGDAALRADLIQLIETVIIYKLPRLSREEIQAMLQVHDIRETRIYQEAKQEGVDEERARRSEKIDEERARLSEKIDEERARHLQDKLRSVAKLAALPLAPNQIAEILELDLDLVREELAKDSPA
jgi:predicted transposase/invertase (TIGR01784 family)